MDFLFPRRCPVCDAIVKPFGEKICFECLKKLKPITPPYCMKCGRKLSDSDTKRLCEECLSEKRHFYIRGRSLYRYSSIASSIYRFKYASRQEYAQFFGEMMSIYLEDFVRSIRPDALIPVPLHKKRMIKRGYNQAYLLAKELSKRLGVPVEKDLVVRTKNTMPLKLQNFEERQNNLKNAFNIARNDVKLKQVIVMDDIYTTGSTIDEVAGVLLESGVEGVYFITLARAGDI